MRGKPALVAAAGVLVALALCVPSLASRDASTLQRDAGMAAPVSVAQAGAGLSSGDDAASVGVPAYDVVERYRLPSFDQVAGGSADKLAAAQVMAKAARVGFASAYPSNPVPVLQALLDDIASHEQLALGWHSQVDFAGSTAAELQQVLDDNAGRLVRIATADLKLDQPVHLPTGAHIDGNGARIWCEVAGAAFVVEGQRDVSIDNLEISGNADIGIFVHDASNVMVRNCHIHDLRSKAVVVAGESTYFHLVGNRLRQNQQGGITVAGGSSYGVLRDNDVSYNTGCSNWMAGIVLTNVDAPSPERLWEAFPGDTPHFAQRSTLADVPASVHDVVVQGNTVAHNQSSGIYCDGIYRCYVLGNTIDENDKEGMCLDYGALGCFVHDNAVTGNGKRARQPDDALELDGMLGFGRLADGSAVAKLPGISLDNAAYNTLEGNTVCDNWGGGVKSVRTSMRNVIAGNLIDNNNRGQNDVFFFIGVELGNADEGAQSDSMDYMADYQNLVVGNTITGGHYTGVFIAHGCEGNTISRNVIKGHTHFAFMCGSDLDNDLSDNEYDGRFIDRSIVPFL